MASDPWTTQEVRELRKLASENTAIRIIAKKLDRSTRAIVSKASEEGINLESTNQPPIDEAIPIRNTRGNPRYGGDTIVVRTPSE